MNSFFIGNVEIEKTAALAPMASVADKSYRLMRVWCVISCERNDILEGSVLW